LLLRMHYQKRIADAFFSVNLTIQKEVFAGWFFHNVHSSGASFFFYVVIFSFVSGDVLW
jgi:ubiquinol-cytochrome c reductase cytochrome b subunit